jgi:GT2 family glycosyltransferase
VGSTLFRYQSLADVDYMRSQADGCEDFDLLVRLALAGKQAYFLPELLMEYRFHGGQTSLKQAVH